MALTLPQPTALANTPASGSLARLYMCVHSQSQITESDEVPLTSEDVGAKGSGDVASLRTHNGGMLYVKNGVAKTFSFQTHAPSSNPVVQAIIAAADGVGDDAIMKFVIENSDGSFDYGYCIVNDKSAVQAPDGIFGYVINCSVMGDGEYSPAS